MLEVVEYFDELVAQYADVEVLVQAASDLAKAPISYLSPTRRVVRFPVGRPYAAPDDYEMAAFLTRRVDESSYVRCERVSADPDADALILERLARAIGVTAGRDDIRSKPTRSIEWLLQSAARHGDQLLEATTCLRLDPYRRYRAVALLLSEPIPETGAWAVLLTPWGLVRGGIVPERVPVSCGGVGKPAVPGDLAESWKSALFALRVRSDEDVALAEDYGALVELASLLDHSTHAPQDVANIESALRTGWTLPELSLLAEGSSFRAIAAVRNLHHSTVAARMPSLTEAWGYDPREALGRTRLHLAILLFRLTHRRFDGMPSGGWESEAR
ncbi:hypothetical protein [Streptomyces muensis]|uniref:PucR C-terminal helix-turn-helix domain-containing protein n=1 Tax=Streptomyces muensis TaxID=1077944 RepID=A0A9X1PU62_STRM4|nr:hypothetical protein [Streptomyces muensis]MCF1592319.1 hypothetical protein [Streptomyces muensis]